jgi:hypothetical protein
VYDGDRLHEGVDVVGPALIDTATTTVVVYPGHSCQVDKSGNVVMDLGAPLEAVG